MLSFHKIYAYGISLTLCTVLSKQAGELDTLGFTLGNIKIPGLNYSRVGYGSSKFVKKKIYVDSKPAIL